MTTTNATTSEILKYLFTRHVFAWRHNVLPVPLAGGRGYRPGSKSGIPDIIGVLPDIGSQPGGKFIGIEIKTGKDRMRPEQIGFHLTAQKLGAVVMVVKDYDDFINQWKEFEQQCLKK